MSEFVRMETIWILFIGTFSFRPVHGLIFLFKYVQDDEPTGSVVRDDRLESIFFAKQVINSNFSKRIRNDFELCFSLSSIRLGHQ